jgi:hypothetical protein
MLQPRLGPIKREAGKQLVNKGQFPAALVKIFMQKAWTSGFSKKGQKVSKRL